MKNKPLFVAFLWHMHQPYYGDPESGVLRLPWVRLHGINDYYKMVKILDDFPGIHQTFNLVPSLVSQLTDYYPEGKGDIFLELTRKKADELEEPEITFLLRNFFMAHRDNRIGRFSGYRRLLEKRGQHIGKEELKKNIFKFSVGELRDLQVFFNLAWFDPEYYGREPLKGLVEKGGGYSENDKETLVAFQNRILESILPAYREALKRGQIDISTTPYYHPILPLLCDNHVAAVSETGITLPRYRFRYPEDALWHIRRSVEFHERFIGEKPVGMWPSEGSLSEEVLALLIGEGFQWTATDQYILSRSLGLEKNREGRTEQYLYRPYRYSKGDKSIHIFFRDQKLSDLISFSYASQPPRESADNLIRLLHRIRKNSEPDERPIVSIILDGENCWEYYPDNGNEFLRRLYEALQADPCLETVTFRDYLAHYRESTGELKSLHPGSWIHADFHIWIGGEEDNRAWDLLYRARKDLVSHQREHPDAEPAAIERAWQEIYIAEGSDWNWWYGEEHGSDSDEEFDRLFRRHLMYMYRTLGMEVPEELFSPILKEWKEVSSITLPTSCITPVIDGIITHFYEWNGAGYFEGDPAAQVMRPGKRVFQRLYFGFDRTNLYLRIDPLFSSVNKLRENRGRLEIEFHTSHYYRLRLDFPTSGNPLGVTLFKKDTNDSWKELKNALRKGIIISALYILEVKLPFRAIGIKPDREIQIFTEYFERGMLVERWPYQSLVSFSIPREDLDDLMWSV